MAFGRKPADPRFDRKNPNREYEKLKAVSAAARGSMDKEAWLNLAFYLDEQYVEWNPGTRALQAIPRVDNIDTPRPVANKIMHFVNQEHAFALQSKPTVDVLPATDDPGDISTAAVSLGYLRWLTEPQVAAFDDELSDATMWALVACEGYLKWIYNPRLKRPDICAVSPLDLYADPYATKFRQARWAIHSQFMDVEQIYDIWGVEVRPESVEQQDVLRAQLLREMGASPVVEGATVNELWLKPTRRHPEGIYYVWTGKEELVPKQRFPYAHGKLPFTQIGQIPRPGSQHYHSAVKYLRSPQMELNKYHAQRIVNREAFANIKWWIDSQLEMEHDPDDSPRQILRGNSQGGQLRPEILQPAAFPDNGDGQWIGEEMMNVVGLHEVSQAQVPGRVESSKAIELLKEADASRQATLLGTIKDAISEGFWQLLMLAKQYVSDEQIVQTYSKDGMPEVQRFKTQDIKAGLRVNVTMTTGLARSRSAREDQLLNYWDRQIITDPTVIAELLEVPMPTLIADKAYDIRLARNENYEMAQGGGGTAIVPNSWDDHETHIKEHNNFRKTHEFLVLSNEAKTKFEHHVATHKTLWTTELTEQIQRMQLVAAASGQQQQGAAQPQTPPLETTAPSSTPAA
jgi:hypothetical protein